MSYQVFLLNLLASGGNGDLYLGYRDDTGANVVVKYLREWQLEHARRAFEREVRILNKNLPGMIPLLFADLKAQQPYYVMPYFPGGSATKHAGRISPQQFLAVASESSRALSLLHDNHIAHGDFKPDNLLVNEQGNLKLADPLGNGFGCTVLFAANRGGTPGYWAPEIRNGRPISHASDVYSYGATLYHLATGIRPHDDVPLNLSLPSFQEQPQIADIIAACSQPLPAARPTMKEVQQMLTGARWIDVQQKRQQQHALSLCAVACLGLLFLLTTD